MRIVAYTYMAEHWTPVAVVNALRERYSLPTLFDDPHEILERYAHQLDINTDDPWSYDSDAFPKPIFDYQIEPDLTLFDGARHVRAESLYL